MKMMKDARRYAWRGDSEQFIDIPGHGESTVPENVDPQTISASDCTPNSGLLQCDQLFRAVLLTKF